MKSRTSIIIIFLLSISTAWAQPVKRSQSKVAKMDVYALIQRANRLAPTQPEQAFAQVEKALKLAKDDKAKGYCYQTLGSLNYKLGRFSPAVIHFQKAQTLFTKISDQKGLYAVTKYLGAAHDALGEYHNALVHYKVFLQKAKVAKNEADEIDTENRIARIYFQQKRYAEALRLYQKILAKEQGQKNDKGVATAYNHIGLVNERMGDISQAAQQYSNAIEISTQNKLKGSRNAGYDNLNRSLRGQKKHKKEMQVRQQAQLENEELKDKEALANNAYNMGDLYLINDSVEQAIPYLKQTIAWVEELEKPEQKLAEASTKIGNTASKPAMPSAAKVQDAEAIYFDTATGDVDVKHTVGTTDDEVVDEENEDEKNLPPSLKEEAKPVGRDNSIASRSGAKAASSERLAVKIDKYFVSKDETEQAELSTLKCQTFGKLSDAYEQKGDYENAFVYLKKANRLSDSLGEIREKDLKDALTLSEDLNLQDDRIRKMEQDQAVTGEKLKSQQNIIWMLLLGLIGLAVGAWLLFRSQAARRRAHQLLALRSLRAQMNPHFIFNSLNAVNSYISSQDTRSANRYLSDFSRLMRQVLEHSAHEFVPLSEELRILELYLKLEHTRFEDKFDYTLEVAPEIKNGNLELPPMLVQPFIENAVWHGLRYRETKGQLNVSFVQQNERLIITVEDNGIGRARSQEIKTQNQSQHKSTGLKNTARRIDLINSLYKNDVNVEVADLNSEAENVGTRVVIQLPLRTV